MSTYKLSNIQIKSSRLQAIIAVKKFFDLYDQPVTVSVAKLNQILQDGITFEHLFEVNKFAILDAFTFNTESIMSDYERLRIEAEREYDEKLAKAKLWYNTLPQEQKAFVETLKGQMIPRA
jgi:hypothetical protein